MTLHDEASCTDTSPLAFSQFSFRLAHCHSHSIHQEASGLDNVPIAHDRITMACGQALQCGRKHRVLRAEWSVVYSCTGATADGARGRAAKAPNAGSRDESLGAHGGSRACVLVHLVVVVGSSGRVDAHACSAAPPPVDRPVEGGPAGRVR